MRGKLAAFGALFRNIRITPADAGKTFTAAKRTRLEQDHPRGCGENALLNTLISFILGSPPRMRGKLPLLSECLEKSGITPADAGKT